MTEPDPLAPALESALSGSADLGAAALTIARLEYPGLEPGPHLEALDRLGERARQRVSRVGGGPARARVAALNGLLFEDEGFAGNRNYYDDFRNSYLNVVLDRRLGIPITLALVYMEVARRADLDVQGVSFPGHFLMRVAQDRTDDEAGGILLDPFEGGGELGVADCRRLLARHLGAAGEDTPFDPALLRPCTPRQMVARMLNNLKRTYLELRSYARARRVTNLLLSVEPMAISELRDRGLLSYHLDDFPAALRDLEDYVRLRAWKDKEDRAERDQMLDHIKTLRRRMAGLN